MGCQLPTPQWETPGLQQAEKQGISPDKDPFHPYCRAGSTTHVTAAPWRPRQKSSHQQKTIKNSLEKHWAAAVSCRQERQQESLEKTKLLISLLPHPQVQPCFQSTHQDAQFLVVFIWAACINASLEKETAFLIPNCCCFLPQPMAQTHSGAEGTGTAASTATHLAANQASELPN